jgi:hypothetical protein
MDDLIRRSDAIEAIEVVDWYHQNRNKDMVSGANSDEHQAWYKADDVYKALEAVPSADRPQEWIPCSEKLPEKEGHYLCSFKKANRIDSIYVDLAYWTGGRWYGYLANEINAWMPLPKPWKGADDE